jgi:hypothetical protein
MKMYYRLKQHKMILPQQCQQSVQFEEVLCGLANKFVMLDIVVVCIRNFPIQTVLPYLKPIKKVKLFLKCYFNLPLIAKLQSLLHATLTIFSPAMSP